ncbi:alpha-amylase family glycosyl hydrolase [Litorimonas sp. RW-G-Af-16]
MPRLHRILLTASASVLVIACQAQPDSTTANEAKPQTQTSTAPTQAAPQASETTQFSNYLTRPPEDDVVYFMLPDRFENGDSENDTGGFPGGKLDHGFDPTHKGFYHGGDLKGLTERLDYIEGLGASAIWLGPIYKNKPVQGGPGQESSGYHGYWITDFTSVDPHLGTNEELKTFVDAAHARNIKVYLDIITNHTADVISYRECYDPEYKGADKVESCDYRSVADYPYTTRGDVTGDAINEGFLGDEVQHQTEENFAKLERSDYAYQPYIPAGEENVKTPAWLNDVKYYHNRGETTFEGESSLYGDFSGLDDLFTEHPMVVDGMIDIFKGWITDYKMDGFRIDTTRHVNPNFWKQFLPAMKEHAAAQGIPNFYMFGEVYDPDPAALARFTRVDGFDQVLDFGFQTAVFDVVSGKSSTDRFDRFLDADALYGEATKQGRTQPTFLGNHDMGRFAGMVKIENPEMSEAELLARTQLAHGLMMFMRGVPVIYSGDEQGFVSDGNDQSARENMFPSQVDVYNDNDLLGTEATTADSNFDTAHPLYRYIAKTAAIRRAHPALSRGDMQSRLTEKDGGVFAFSRFDPDTGHEYLIAANTSPNARTVNISIDASSSDMTPLLGDCPALNTTGNISLNIAPFDLVICRSATPASRFEK